MGRFLFAFIKYYIIIITSKFVCRTSKGTHMALGSEFTNDSFASFRFQDELRKEFEYFLATYGEDDDSEPYAQLTIFHVMAAIIWADKKYGLANEGDYLLVNGFSFLNYVTIPDPAIRAAVKDISYDEVNYRDILPDILTKPFDIVVSPPAGFGEDYDLEKLRSFSHWTEAPRDAYDALVRLQYDHIPANIRNHTIRVACMTAEETEEPPTHDESVLSVSKDGVPILLPSPFETYRRT